MFTFSHYPTGGIAHRAAFANRVRVRTSFGGQDLTAMLDAERLRARQKRRAQPQASLFERITRLLGFRPRGAA